MDRTVFLDRVRAALGEAPGPELPTEWPPTPASGDGTVDPERFAAALAATGGLARRVGRPGLADAIADVARELRSGRTVVVTADADRLYRTELDEGLVAARADAVRPSPDGWRGEAARADLGITSAALAVCSTGSVLLVPGPECPRVASLLPPAHLVLLPVERLVPGLEDVMPVLADGAAAASSAVLVTGPSRTSDIEMITVLGVHGPRVVRVLVVE